MQKVNLKNLIGALDSGALKMVDESERPRLLGIAARGPEWQRGEHESFAVIAYLERLEKFFNCFFGVESNFPDSPEFFYLNSGETYQPILVWKSGALLWMSMGDDIEQNEIERFEQDNERRCCYCGEWGDADFFNSEGYCEDCALTQSGELKCLECGEFAERDTFDDESGECLKCAAPESEVLQCNS